MNSNKHFIKYISVFLALLIILSVTAVPALAAFVTSTGYQPFYKEYIGTVGRPVAVYGDGTIAMTDDSGEQHIISFGMSSTAEISFANEMYPVVSQTFTYGDITYTLIRFAGEIPVSRYGNKIQAVFTKLKVENGGKEDIPAPLLPENSVLLGENSAETVPSGETSFFEYCTTVVPLSEKVTGTFDSGLAEMTSYWDEKVKGDDGIKISVSDSDSYMKYIKSRIYSLIGAENENCDVCLAEAINLLSGGKPTEKEKVVSAAKEAVDSLTPLAVDYCLKLTDGIPNLSDNADVLVTLKSYAYICGKSGDAAGEKEYSEYYSKLLHSVEKAMKNTVSVLPCDWEAATVKGSTDNMMFGLSAYSSAESLRRWYTAIAPFGGDGQSYLASLARKSFDYAEKIGAPDTFVSSLVFADEAGTVTVGAGCPASCLTGDNKISVENYKLPDSTAFGYSVESDGKEITVTTLCRKPVSVILQFPVFAENIESASCPFDTSAGTVTVPAGCNSVTVQLITPAYEICERNGAKLKLETSLFAAWSADKEDCTSLSVKNLEEKYEKALELREGTAEEMTSAAEELSSAVSQISKTVAEYVIDLSDGIITGKIETEKICQRFKVEEGGVLSDVTVAGEFREGVFLKVYSLRENGYALASPVGETEGKMCDMGFLFTLNIPAEAQTEYVLYLTSDEKAEYSVRCGAFDESGMYKFSGSDILIYPSDALDAKITVTGADRGELETLYAKYTEASLKGFTKESVKNLEKAEKAAANVLCTPYVTTEKCNEVLESMKKAYNSLETYPSDEKKVDSPLAVIIMTAGAVVLLGVTAVSVIVANKRKDKKKDGNN